MTPPVPQVELSSKTAPVIKSILIFENGDNQEKNINYSNEAYSATYPSYVNPLKSESESLKDLMYASEDMRKFLDVVGSFTDRMRLQLHKMGVTDPSSLIISTIEAELTDNSSLVSKVEPESMAVNLIKRGANKEISDTSKELNQQSASEPQVIIGDPKSMLDPKLIPLSFVPEISPMVKQKASKAGRSKDRMRVALHRKRVNRGHRLNNPRACVLSERRKIPSRLERKDWKFFRFKDKPGLEKTQR